ncbi:MAG: RNA polymerase sigma factor [bacterium]|nr:RNA polymerase sigma factor [bacterium]
MGHNDIDDIAASIAGDQAAYARLVARYENKVAAQMWRFTRDRRMLDELTQDVFVEAYTSLPGFRQRAPFEHWLRRIATRVGYRFWKHKARDTTRRELLAQHEAVRPRYTELAEPSEAAETLFGLLEELPPKDRLVLTLMYFDELDTREIADRTGWSRTLVKVRAHRARRKLRARLECLGFGRTDDARPSEGC